MCFLPYRRTSIDQAPGPIIANAAARIACARVTHGSSESKENRKMAIHTLAAAAIIPANGVNTSTNRNIAAAMPVICRATVNGHSITDAADSETDQSCAGEQTQKKKTRTRPFTGKCRK
jgi:hypothetical protein